MIRRASVCFPEDPKVVVAKVNRFGFVGRNFKENVHIFAPGLKSSRNHKALLSAKLNPVRLDGEPHNPFGLLSAAGVVHPRDELTKRQGLPLLIGFHDTRLGQATARALWGVCPIWGFCESDVLGARLRRRLRAEPGAGRGNPNTAYRAKR